MRKAGLECLRPMEQFQVMGFVDVFFALPRLISHFYFLSKKILMLNPKIALFIDYPGFCLRMEKHLKKKNFTGKIIHYICPSIWAWGKKRIPIMEQNLDLLLSIFPFERKYFSPNFPIKYIGHPLMARIQKHTTDPLDWTLGKKVLSLFPGSRKKEIIRNFPLQIATYKKLLEINPDLCCAISLSQEAFIPLLTNYLAKANLTLNDCIRFVPIHRTYDLMRNSFLAIAKSGTITLELALYKVPTVVIYAISPLDLFIAKNVLKIILPFYCLTNIIAQTEVFKELIGPYATQKNLYIEAAKLLQDSSYREEKQKLCQGVIDTLGKENASEKAAEHLLTLLKKSF
jgi:lipid-A-disaccharide synthase